MSQLSNKVEQYVKSQLENYKPSIVRAPKIIHDTVLGSNVFEPFEVALLDLPLIQRLRRINQVDVVTLVFPSGNHNRFEHTLGVAVLGEKLINALWRRKSDLLDEYDFRNLLIHVRVAAIMHDCGHGPFSHTSEQVYKYYTDMKEEKQNNPELSGASPHEILSYLIVKSDAFSSYFNERIAKQYNISVDLNLVAQMIVGYVANPKFAFLVEIINGAFDADKLDYIQRDSHFTGIKMVLDVDRLFHSIELIIDEKGFHRLSVDLSGVATLEQIVFNKMMLFSSVYHHHKVRAAECLFRSIFDFKKRMLDLDFDSAADFLYLTDDDIYGLAKHPENGIVTNLVNDLNNRNLPKRSLVFSHQTVKKGYETNLGDLMALCETPDGMMKLREAISEETNSLGNFVPAEDIWIDMPAGPSFKEAIQWPIKIEDKEKGYVRLRDLFPVDDWTRAFSENKWKGYIFTRPDLRNVVYKASKNILFEAFKIELNDLSYSLCKIS